MEDDLKFDTKLTKEELIEFVKDILPAFYELNLELTERTETYYIQKVNKRSYEEGRTLSFFMLQFTIKENENSTTLTLSTQTKMISLLVRVLFIPFIWFLILGFSFSETLINTFYMVLGGIILTLIILFNSKKSKKHEEKFIEFFQNKLRQI